MFICEDCKTHRMEYAIGSTRSYGQCEVCNQLADCLDSRAYKEKNWRGADQDRHTYSAPESGTYVARARLED